MSCRQVATGVAGSAPLFGSRLGPCTRRDWAAGTSTREVRSLTWLLEGLGVSGLTRWLDHDQGNDDTIRPVVSLMAQLASTGSLLNVGQVHIHAANVGAGHWIRA